MIGADNGMNPLLFGSHPTDTRSRINPEIWIRIQYHFGWGSSALGVDAVADCMLIVLCKFLLQNKYDDDVPAYQEGISSVVSKVLRRQIKLYQGLEPVMMIRTWWPRLSQKYRTLPRI